MNIRYFCFGLALLSISSTLWPAAVVLVEQKKVAAASAAQSWRNLADLRAVALKDRATTHQYLNVEFLPTNSAIFAGARKVPDNYFVDIIKNGRITDTLGPVGDCTDSSMRFSPDGKSIAVMSESHLTVWQEYEPEKWKRVVCYRDEAFRNTVRPRTAYMPDNLIWSPDGTILIVNTDKQVFDLRDHSKFDLVHIRDCSKKTFSGFASAWSPDGEYLLVGDRQRPLPMKFNASTFGWGEQVLLTERGMPLQGVPPNLVWLKNGNLLSREGQLFERTIKDGAIVFDCTSSARFDKELFRMALSPDGTLVAGIIDNEAGDNKPIVIYDVASRKQKCKLEVGADKYKWPCIISWTNDGSAVFVDREDVESLCDAKTGAYLFQGPSRAGNSPRCRVLSADGKYLFIGEKLRGDYYSHAFLTIYDSACPLAVDQRPIVQIPALGDSLRCAYFSESAIKEREALRRKIVEHQQRIAQQELEQQKKLAAAAAVPAVARVARAEPGSPGLVLPVAAVPSAPSAVVPARQSFGSLLLSGKNVIGALLAGMGVGGTAVHWYHTRQAPKAAQPALPAAAAAQAVADKQQVPERRSKL
jgi:hypothetical protein